MRLRRAELALSDVRAGEVGVVCWHVLKLISRRVCEITDWSFRGGRSRGLVKVLRADGTDGPFVGFEGSAEGGEVGKQGVDGDVGFFESSSRGDEVVLQIDYQESGGHVGFGYCVYDGMTVGFFLAECCVKRHSRVITIKLNFYLNSAPAVSPLYPLS